MSEERRQVTGYTAMTYPNKDAAGRQRVDVELVLDVLESDGTTSKHRFILIPDQAGVLATQLQHEADEAKKQLSGD